LHLVQETPTISEPISKWATHAIAENENYRIHSILISKM
jgi:hypothetical protein